MHVTRQNAVIHACFVKLKIASSLFVQAVAYAVTAVIYTGAVQTLWHSSGCSCSSLVVMQRSVNATLWAAHVCNVFLATASNPIALCSTCVGTKAPMCNAFVTAVNVTVYRLCKRAALPAQT
jgi:uncharacterized membrane-anchored protein